MDISFSFMIRNKFIRIDVVHVQQYYSVLSQQKQIEKKIFN